MTAFGPEAERLWALLPEARVAGGAVRDFIAGVAVADVDFASPLAPEAVMARLKAAGVKIVPTGIKHGTVTAVLGGKGFEITTLRRDVATDGRWAEVAFTDDWEADAARRDFTINAMTMAADGEVFDYFGGRADLAAGVVRFVGDAETRIREDYLRVLRFFRFFARYAKGAPDAAAVAAITKLRDGVRQLSVERVWSEVKRILAAPDPRGALRLMRETGVLAVALPEVVGLEGFEKLVAAGAPVEPMLRVAALLGDVEGFAARLKLSGEEVEVLLGYSGALGLAPANLDDDLRRALAEQPAEVWVARSWLQGGGGADWDGLRARLAGIRRPVFPLRGRDVTALGVKAGPKVGEVLEEVRGWWRDGGCVADREDCVMRARKIISL